MTMTIKCNSLIYFLLLIILLLMSVFSTTIMTFKEVLVVAVVMLIVFFSIMKITLTFDLGISVWMFLYVVSNLWSMLYGRFVIGNPHAFTGLNVMVIEPILFYIIICYIEEDKFDYIENTFKCVLFCVLLYNLLYFLCLNHLLPLNPDLFIGNYPNYGGLSIGFIKYHSNNVPWLIFLVPMIICKILISRRNTLFDLILLVLGIFSALLTLRTGFIIALAISPFIVFVLAGLSGCRLNKRSILIAVCAGLAGIALVVFSSGMLKGLITGAVDKVMLSLTTTANSVDSGGHTRILQIEDLLKTWLERPLLGWGASANARNIIRSDTPGVYEMQYHAMLMQKGLIGFIVYISLLAWLFTENIKLIRRGSEYGEFTLCILVGLLSVLIANATNPYLGSFDRMIMLFLPLLTIRMNRASEAFIL